MDNLEVDNARVEEQSCFERFCQRFQQLSSFEKKLCVSVALLLLLVVILAIMGVVYAVAGSAPQYCVSKDCVITASQLIRNMNTSADPCSDFYEYACGGWKNKGGDEEDTWSARMTRDTTRQASDLLSRTILDTDFEAVKKARRLYRSCMATDVLDTLGLEPLMEILDKAGLPRGVPDWDTAIGFDLSRTLARVQRTVGKPVLMDVLRENDGAFTIWMPTFDLGNTPNIRVLEAIDWWVKAQPKNNSGPQTNSTFMTDWQGFVKNVAKLNAGMEDLKAERLSKSSGLNEWIDFMPPKSKKQQLSAAMITQLMYNKTVPNNASNTLYYEVYMQTLLEGRHDVNWTVSNGTLRLADPELHSLLASTLKNFSPLDTQLFVWLEVVAHFGVYTTTSLRQQMQSRLIAMKSRVPRSETCAELLITLMPVVVDHLIAQVDPRKEASEKVKAMTKEIKKSQLELVKTVAWFDDTGLQNILQRLNDVEVIRVGFLDWVVKGDKLDEFYDEVVVNEGELLHSIADIQVWQAESNLFVSPRVGRLRTDQLMASAYYFRTMNTITVRPMMMQFPFYSLGLEALNYGAMGLVLGHEFGHALDAEAFTSNEYFSLGKPGVEKVDAFVNCTKQRIEEISAKLNSSVYPNLSKNEDIADITGVKSALYTFNKIRSGSEPHLPGLERFTHDQLFFLAFGNVWCTNGKPPGRDVEDGPHNDNQLRVLSAASNTPEFARIWNCPLGTPMNPPNKCTFL